MQALQLGARKCSLIPCEQYKDKDTVTELMTQKKIDTVTELKHCEFVKALFLPLVKAGP